MKVAPLLTLGIPVYNNANNVKNLVHALLTTVEKRSDVELLVLDDCSPNPKVVDELEQFCRLRDITFLRNEVNRGVPASWNKLCAAAQADVVLLLNDDVRPLTPNWLDPVCSIFQLNPEVAITYWCQKLVDAGSGICLRYTSDSQYLVSSGVRHPLLRPMFAGAFFGIRKSFWADIRQPDGSVGFWEDLLAFGEELDFSLECHQRKMQIVQLPLVWEHLKSQTFTMNPSARLRPQASEYLPLPEYAELRRQHNAVFGDGPPSWPRFRSRVRRFVRKHFATAQPVPVGKLDYSLAMLLKKWKGREMLGCPAEQYIASVIANGFPTALRDALKIGALQPPAPIRYRLDGAEVTASLEECLSDPSAVLK